MRLILLFMALILLQAVSAHHVPDTSQQYLLRQVDSLRPIITNADSFPTAQRMVYRDYDAFIKRPGNTTYTNLNNSLERLGAIAGYTDPWVCKSNIRSVVTYRRLRQNADITAMKQYEVFYCRARRR